MAVVRNVNIKVEAVLGLMMESSLDIPEVLQPPPGHALEGEGGVVRVGQVLGTDGAVGGGREDS